MSKLGKISEGEWVSGEVNGYKSVQDDKGNLIAYMSAKPQRPHKANMDLIADAGTTANKCNMLFSEVLEERDLALGFLKVAKCPNSSCDNKGTMAYQNYPSGEWHPEPCEWCHRKMELIKSIEETK